jgi:hypothetical protein
MQKTPEKPGVLVSFCLRKPMLYPLSYGRTSETRLLPKVGSTQSDFWHRVSKQADNLQK